MKFTESHEWIEVEQGVGVVGISNHAQKELGEVVYVQLPRVGQLVSAGDEVAVLESTKAACDIYSPVSGEVVEINEKVKDNLHLLNKLPQSEGWLFKIRITSPLELDALLDDQAYLSLIV